MRYIDLSSLELPDGWQDEAETAREKVKQVYRKRELIREVEAAGSDMNVLRAIVAHHEDDFLDELRVCCSQNDDEVDLSLVEVITATIGKLGDQIRISDEIAKYANATWRALKPKLNKLIEGIEPSDEYPEGKCWYCESRYRVRMLEVDHFRPKASVRGDNDFKSDDGYWWLAFEYTNFRLSCQTCNRLEKGDDGLTRGKGTWFPLADENKRAYNGSEIINESPLLLDPTVAEDVQLLVFLADGSVQPASPDEDSVEYKRVKRSIDIYHLDAPRDKRMAICVEISNLILEADNAYRDFADPGNTARTRTTRLKEFDEKVERLFTYFFIQAQYSSAAKDEAKRQAKLYEWIAEIVEEIE